MMPQDSIREKQARLSPQEAFRRKWLEAEHESQSTRVNPYPGLRSFNVDEAHIFRARVNQVAALRKTFAGASYAGENRHVIMVVGGSSSGKSSIVKAGLLADIHSLQMPDGSKTALDAIATDLNSQVLKGRVEGKNTGKSLLARSLSGIGQGATLLVGRGNLNQPLSEQDLLRERVGENIGLASDQEVTRLALNEHVVVSLSAGTPIYIVLQDSAKQPKPSENAVHNTQPSGSPNTQELRELLQLQRELNQSVVPTPQNN